MEVHPVHFESPQDKEWYYHWFPAPRSRDDLKVHSIREALGVADDQILILTVGGDATSKGAQEGMQALALRLLAGNMSVKSGLSPVLFNGT